VLLFIAPAGMGIAIVTVPAIITSFPIAIRGHLISHYQSFKEPSGTQAATMPTFEVLSLLAYLANRPGVQTMLGSKASTLRSEAYI